MAREPKPGLTVHSMKATGVVVKHMAREDLYMLMVMFTRVIGAKTKLRETANIFTPMVPCMKVNGSMINSMAWLKKSGQMDHAMRASTRMEERMALDLSSGLIGLPIPDTSLATTLKAKALISGLMKGLSRVTGSTIRCMARECLLGVMAESMRVTTLMTGSRVMVSLAGLTAGDMRASGTMASSTGRACRLPAEEN
jgi:hypothetical protein